MEESEAEIFNLLTRSLTNCGELSLHASYCSCPVASLRGFPSRYPGPGSPVTSLGAPTPHPTVDFPTPTFAPRPHIH